MPRMPDLTALGSRPIPQAGGGGIVSDRSGVIQANAIDEAGRAITGVGEEIFQRQRQVAHVKATNALLDNELQVKSTIEDIRQRVSTGELPYANAQQEYDARVQKLELPKIDHIDPLVQSQLDQGAKVHQAQGQAQIGGIVFAAEKQDYGDQAAAALDKLGKLAGMPGANIDDINSRADALLPVIRRSGMNEAQAGKLVQDFKDRTWFNHATQRAMESAESLPALNALQHDLTSEKGMYAQKLDTDKRNAVLRSVLADKQQILNRAEHESDRRETRAERALAQIDQQISTGTPASADQWAAWEQTVRGTSVADEFKSRIADEKQVQDVLRQPVADQISFVQGKQQKLDTEGGTLRDRANLARLSNAVKANVNLLQTAPLVFNANRTGTEVQPVDFTALADPAASQDLGHQLRERMNSLAAMRKEYGAAIPNRPLLPQEAQQLAGVLQKASPEQAAQTFAALHDAIQDVDTYKGAMQQIAPDAPVKAMAGLMAARDANLTGATHWFSPNEETLNSRVVAATMLQGERMLDATKADKAEDGKPKTGLYLPKDADLQSSFQDAVGKAFAGRSDAAQNAYQAVKAYYVGKAVQTGRLAASKDDIDPKLVAESVKAVLGNVVDYNGNGAVLAPWGMDAGDFSDSVKSAFASEVKRRGLPPSLVSADFGLRNFGDGSYYVTDGRNFLKDAKGQPVTIQVAK